MDGEKKDWREIRILDDTASGQRGSSQKAQECNN